MLKSFKIGDYLCNGELIGGGAFSNVCKGINVNTDEIVAIKIIKMDILEKSKKLKSQLEIEINLLKTLTHPNIIKCYGIFQHPETDAVCIVLEYCDGGSLEDYLRKKNKIRESDAINIIWYIISGMIYLNNHNIIHRDLKPENLLVKYNYIEQNNANNVKKIFNLKIADFGLSTVINTGMAQTQCGSRLYMAPEIILGEKYNHKVDIWSIGSIFFKLLTGVGLFKVMPNIKNYSYNSAVYTPDLIMNTGCIISENSLDFLKKILVNDPAKRLDYDDIISHPLFSRISGNRQSKIIDKISDNNISSTNEILVLSDRDILWENKSGINISAFKGLQNDDTLIDFNYFPIQNNSLSQYNFNILLSLHKLLKKLIKYKLNNDIQIVSYVITTSIKRIFSTNGIINKRNISEVKYYYNIFNFAYDNLVDTKAIFLKEIIEFVIFYNVLSTIRKNTLKNKKNGLYVCYLFRFLLLIADGDFFANKCDIVAKITENYDDKIKKIIYFLENYNDISDNISIIKNIIETNDIKYILYYHYAEY